MGWIKRIIEELPDLEALPRFDWAHFSQELAKESGLGLHAEAKKQAWKESHELKQGIGSQLLTLTITVAPLGSVLWMVSFDDIAKIFGAATHEKRKKVSEGLQEGFYRFLALRALHSLQAMEPFKEFSLQISEEEVSFESALCVDVEMRIAETVCWGRLAIPKEIYDGWKAPESIPREAAKEVSVHLSVEAGSVSLTDEDWGRLQQGDFLVLDKHSYNLKEQRGKAQLVLNGRPLFQLDIKNGKVHVGEKLSAEKTSSDAIRVEIASADMSLDHLLHLKAGEVLDVPLETTVALMKNGEKIGSAEWLYLGEKLGVRILETGSLL